jgi:membrane protease YdiL (CAAX protease family)
MWPPRTEPARTRLAPFLVYVCAFHLTWIAWPYLVYPRLVALGERTLAYAVLNLTIRLLVWVAPVFLYLRCVDGVQPLDYLKLRPIGRRALAVSAVLTAVNLLGSIARFGPPHPSMERVTWNSVLGTSLLVGFIEEIPYRGFMLQKFSERLGFWIAALITSALFVAVHLPGWLALHSFRSVTTATIFVFGVVMALAFKYSKSLWAPILTHSANDFLSFVVFHV